MDDLIRIVSEKAGITGEQAKNAVSAVMDFVKEKVPMVGDQLKGLIGGEGNPLGNVAGKIGGLFGK